MSGIIATPSNEMPPEPRVPYDILAEVIDILGQTNHTNDLKNISSLSTSCRHLCRKHLFRNISINGVIEEDLPSMLRKWPSNLVCTKVTPRHFIALVNDHPDVIPHIQTFRLIYMYKTDDPEFARALGRLTNLTTFDLQLSGTVWDDCVTRIIHSMAHLPLLQTLQLHRVSRLPLAALAILPNIQHLQIYHLSKWHQSVPDLNFLAEVAVRSTPVKPKSLSIAGPVIWDFHLSGPEGGQVLIDWSELSKMEFMAHKDQDAEFMTKFLASQPTRLKALQQLSVVARYSVGLMEGSTALHLQHVNRWIVPYRKTLTTLNFTSLVMPRMQSLKMGVYTAFCHALNSLRETDNVLETLTMRITVARRAVPKTEREKLMKIDRESWMEIPDTLLRSGWGSLKVVSIGVDFHNSYVNRDVLITELLEIFSSRLHNQHFRYIEL